MKLATFALLFIWVLICIFECESLFLCHGRRPCTSTRKINGKSWKISNLNRRFSEHDSGACSDDFATEGHVGEETQGIAPCDSDSMPTSCQAEHVSENDDPLVVAQRKLEEELNAELKSARDLLRKEQSELFDIQEKLFESGRNGYLLVQAQINDFGVCWLVYLVLS